MDSEKVTKAAATHAAIGAAGFGLGAAAKHAIAPQQYQRVPIAAQVGSAMGAAAATGAGVSGTVAAGTAVVAAKAAAVGAAAVAAAPFVAFAAIAGGTIWATIKVIDAIDS